MTLKIEHNLTLDPKPRSTNIRSLDIIKAISEKLQNSVTHPAISVYSSNNFEPNSEFYHKKYGAFYYCLDIDALTTIQDVERLNNYDILKVPLKINEKLVKINLPVLCMFGVPDVIHTFSISDTLHES